MATQEKVIKVWIEDGCIVCDACENAAPEVFEVLEETCIIRPAALDAEFTQPRSQEIKDAAEECPVDVIKFETVPVEATEDESVAKGDEEAVPAVAAEVSKGANASAEEAGPAPVSTAAGVSKKLEPKPGKAAKPAPRMEPELEPALAAAGAALDDGVKALLGAATSRGGNVKIIKKEGGVPAAVESWKSKPAAELPPDARQAKVLAAAKKAAMEPDTKRRAVVGGAALTVGWTAFGVGAGLSVGPALGRFMMPNVLEEPDPRIRVGKLQKYAEMQPGDVNEDFKSQGVWMIREGNRIAALSIICTHLGCIPNWLPNDRKFKCPCHGSGYKPNGINFEGPTPRPLERFRVFVEDGIVVVDKSKKYQYELGQWDMLESYIEV